MEVISASGIDWSDIWTWFLLFGRFGGIMSAIPGVGTNSVPPPFRAIAAMAFSIAVTVGGHQAQLPTSLAEGGLMIVVEFLLGYVLGSIPAFIIGSVTIAGQVSSGTIGLGQANLIDPSIGGSVAVLARIQSQVATLFFLLIDGHHIVIRAGAQLIESVGIGLYRPGMNTAMILFELFAHSFQLALIVTAPVLITTLLTQFVLGLITKFVPQVNVFIVSLPLTIGVGLYIIAFTFPGMIDQMISEFSKVEELSAQILQSGS